MMNYSLGGPKGPGKKKKVKGKPTAEDTSKEGKEKRLAKYNTPTHRKNIKETLKINTQSQTAIDEGLKLNEHGAPDGGHQDKKRFFSLIKKKTPKSKF